MKPEFLGVTRRKRNIDHVQTSVRVAKRLYLHAKEELNIPLTLEAALEAALRARGIDPSKPHPDELWPGVDDGKTTYRKAIELGWLKSIDDPGEPADGAAAQ